MRTRLEQARLAELDQRKSSNCDSRLEEENVLIVDCAHRLVDSSIKRLEIHVVRNLRNQILRVCVNVT